MPPITLTKTPWSTEVLDTTQESVSNLCPFVPRAMQEFLHGQQAMQEFMQREVQALNALAAAQTPLVVPQDFTDAMFDIRESAITAQEFMQRDAQTFRTMAEENAWFQRIQKDLLTPFSLIEEENKQLQMLAASLAPMLPTLERVSYIHLDPAASERRMCANALEAFSHDLEHAMWFVTKLLTFPRSYFTAVWQALHEGRWMNADKPLKYVRGVAWRIHKRDAEQQTLLLFYCSTSHFFPSTLALPGHYCLPHCTSPVTHGPSKKSGMTQSVSSTSKACPLVCPQMR